MIKYGLKLWSVNKKYFLDVIDFYHTGLIDFAELYIVPNTFRKREAAILKNIPVQIHAPHSLHSFNVFGLDKEKIDLFKNQVVEAADFFDSQHIILHSGVGSDLKIFKRNIKKISDKRILVENKPKIGLDNRICFGYSLSQLRFIKKKCKLSICLDISHAIKSALSQKKDYKKYLETLIKTLEPDYFHVSDGLLIGEEDEHLSLGKGDFDLKWIKNILNKLSKTKDISIVIETPKGKDNLENDAKNINFFKNKI